MAITTEISTFVQQGRSKNVQELVRKALEEGMAAKEILEEGLLAGIDVIGDKFKKNEVFLPEVLVSARAMNKGMELLRPYLIQDGVEAKGVAVTGTVKGDLHDIGKNLVKIMLEGKGITVIDLGTDVSPEAFVDAAIEHNANLICCSALLTTTMGAMGEVVRLAEEAGIRDKVKIMVGGAPVDQRFCDTIGADTYTRDAASAADAAVAHVNK